MFKRLGFEEPLCAVHTKKGRETYEPSHMTLDEEEVVIPENEAFKCKLQQQNSLKGTTKTKVMREDSETCYIKGGGCRATPPSTMSLLFISC